MFNVLGVFQGWIIWNEVQCSLFKACSEFGLPGSRSNVQCFRRVPSLDYLERGPLTLEFGSATIRKGSYINR